MFLWATPTGMSVFHTEFASASATLAKDQGLYNGFLAAVSRASLVEGATSTS